MKISKKIILTYLAVFLLVSITAYLNVNKIINVNVNEEIVTDSLNLKLTSNYEQYTEPFRSKDFLVKTNRDQEDTIVIHKIEKGKHVMDITFLNFKNSEIKIIKNTVSKNINNERKILKECINNFLECKSLLLKLELIKVTEKIYPPGVNDMERINIVTCLLNKYKSFIGNVCDETTMKFIIKKNIEPVQAQYIIKNADQDNNKNDDTVITITLIILSIFLSILFTITFPILMLLSKYRL